MTLNPNDGAASSSAPTTPVQYSKRVAGCLLVALVPAALMGFGLLALGIHTLQLPPPTGLEYPPRGTTDGRAFLVMGVVFLFITMVPLIGAVGIVRGSGDGKLLPTWFAGPVSLFLGVGILIALLVDHREGGMVLRGGVAGAAFLAYGISWLWKGLKRRGGR